MVSSFTETTTVQQELTNDNTHSNIMHYNKDDYHAGWMDTVVTERLSSSSVVISPFASCGLSLLSGTNDKRNTHGPHYTSTTRRENT